MCCTPSDSRPLEDDLGRRAFVDGPQGLCAHVRQQPELLAPSSELEYFRAVPDHRARRIVEHQQRGAVEHRRRQLDHGERLRSPGRHANLGQGRTWEGDAWTLTRSGRGMTHQQLRAVFTDALRQRMGPDLDPIGCHPDRLPLERPKALDVLWRATAAEGGRLSSLVQQTHDGERPQYSRRANVHPRPRHDPLGLVEVSGTLCMLRSVCGRCVSGCLMGVGPIGVDGSGRSCQSAMESTISPAGTISAFRLSRFVVTLGPTPALIKMPGRRARP